MTAAAELRAGRRTIAISSPDKLPFGPGGPTKLDVATYYVDVAERMLPCLADRPIHVRSYPEGIEAEGFVRKQPGEHFPDWIKTVEVPKREGGSIRQVIAADAATVAYLAGQNAISLHGWMSRADRLEHPDQLVIDLDPTGDDFGAVRDAARLVRDVLEEVGLPAFLKTTGSRGLHVLAPLDRSADFELAGRVAAGIAAITASLAPDRLTVEVRKNKRDGRIFVDWLRNGYAQTAVVPYSIRARPGAPVAMPIAWRELSRVSPRQHTVANARRRIARTADPWAGMRRRARSLSGPAKRVERMLERAGMEPTRPPE